MTLDSTSTSPQSKTVRPNVGYKQPPVEHQFEKGKSGNPRGRPRSNKPAANPGAPFFDAIVLAEAHRPVEIIANGKKERIPVAQAVVRSAGVAAAKGDPRAQAQILGLFRSVGERQALQIQKLFESIVAYKADVAETLADCDRRGAPHPKIVPHPDDLAFNARTGEISYNGPLDEADKAAWDGRLALIDKTRKEISRLQRDAKKTGADINYITAEIKSRQNAIDQLRARTPDEETRRQPGFNIVEWTWEQQKLSNVRQRCTMKSKAGKTSK